MPPVTEPATSTRQPAASEPRFEHLARTLAPTIYCPSTRVMHCVRDHQRREGQR